MLYWCQNCSRYHESNTACQCGGAVVSTNSVPQDVPQDARELERELCIEMFGDSPDVRTVNRRATMLINYRARILDEAAERATAWWYSGDESAKRGVDPELDKLADELRAAVRGNE